MQSVLVGLAVLSTTNLILGSLLGYHAVGAYLVFWTLSGLLAVTAWNVATRAFAATDVLDAWIRAGVVAMAVVVLCGLVLGALGSVTVVAYLAAQTACFGASFLLKPRRAPLDVAPARPDLPILVVAIVGALLAFSVAFGVTHASMTLYDSLSYHLFFPARWLQERALSIIPTPFSDEAQAYAPANGELFFLWLMLPFHGDFLARIGQLPFALLAAATLYALGRRLGAPPQHAAYPPAFFLLARPVLEQIVGANVDVVCAAMFLTSLYLGIVAVDSNEPRDWALWGVSLGLHWGSKYVALVYVPIFLLLAVARGPRVRTLWALPGIAAFGLPWYVRNWVVAGSPIYPSGLQIAGLTLARGAFSRGAMLNSVFHTTDLRLVPTIVAHAFGPTLVLFWAPLALVGAAAMVGRGWWPYGFLVAVPLLMAPLYWFGLPVNVDSRFLLPAVGPALLPLAFAFPNSRASNRAMHVVYAFAMIWIVVGVRASIPATLPWFLDGWLALDGLLTRPFLVWFGLLALLIGLTWRWTSDAPRWAVPLTLALCAGATSVLAVGQQACTPPECDVLDVTSPFIRPDLMVGWQWVAARTKASTIAYTGINLPYPLTGEHLTNRVVYVNIDGHLRWRFHDYDRAHRAGMLAASPALAIGSGELRPVSQTAGSRSEAARPRFERIDGYQDAWVGNLEALGVTHLFVSALSAYEVGYVWHNEDGFPIEDTWAQMDPDLFRLEYENRDVRIYAVAARSRP